MHERGVMHGDIKPANIMVDRQGRVRILDFGVARAFSGPDSPSHGEHTGTLPYMAPELLHGGEAGAYSDLFSAGVLLYRMLAGRLPFDGAYDAEVVYAITNKTPLPLREAAPGASAELEAIVDRLLEKDPRKRCSKAAEVARELHALSTSSSRPKKGRLARLFIALGLALAALAAAYWLSPGDRRDLHLAPGQSPMIAVLPFDNLGAPGDEYFSDGVTDAVTTALARRGNCRVISRHSSMLYKATTKPLSQVAAELGADLLVTGSIHWTKDKSDSVRITLALVEPATDAYVWTNDYADRRDKIFVLQSEMARDVAHALAPEETRGAGGETAGQPTASLAAYDVFLRGNEYFYRSWERADLEMARKLYGRAVALDSTFALAMAMMARADASLFWERYDPSPGRRESAFALARRALALAPDLAEAHLALGYCYYHGDRDFERALAQFEAGLTLDPSHSDLWNAVAAVHRRQGLIEQSLAEFEQALKLDPRSYLKAFDVGLTLGMLRRFGEAEIYLERTTLLAPDYATAWIYRSWLPVLDNGDTAAARRTLKAAASVTDLSRSKYYWILCRIIPLPESALTAPRSLACDLVSYYLYRARLARRDVNDPLERAYSDSARQLLESAVRAYPSDAYAQSELGIALAGLGDPRGAFTHGQEALQLLPASREAFDAPFLILNSAEIFVVLGARDEAVDLLKRLLQIPGFASREYLKLDFVWAPLGDHPKFLQLLKRPQDSSVAEMP